MNATEIVLPGIGRARAICRSAPASFPTRPGQAVVRVEATGVSFAEQQMRRGKYYDQPPFPFVPGYDLVGVVERTGDRRGPAWSAAVAALTKTGGWARPRADRRRRPGRACPTGWMPARRRDRGGQRGHRLADAAPAREGPRRGRRSSCSARRRRRLHAGAAGPPRGHPRDRHRRPRASRSACASSARSRSTTATEDVPAPSARSRRTAWTPSSTTSAARRSSTPGGCSRRAGRSSPTARAATSDVPGNSWLPVLKLLGAADGLERHCPTGAAPRSSTSGPAAAAPGALPRRAAPRPHAVLAAPRRRRDPRAGRRAVPAHRRGRGAALRRGGRDHREGRARCRSRRRTDRESVTARDAED